MVFVGRVLYLDAAPRSRGARRNCHEYTLPQTETETVNVPRSGSYVAVLVSCGARAEARKIARAVVENRLAACVNVLETPVESFYRWKGKVQREREFLLVIKTSRGRLKKLQAEIERLHSYEVPEFIALPIVSSSPAYLRWLQESLTGR